MLNDKAESSHFASLHYVDQNYNYLQENRNYSESNYSLTEEPSYARPSNCRISPNERKGNWGSIGFILGCHNIESDLKSPSMLEKEKMAETKHYTMAWIQEQNK